MITEQQIQGLAYSIWETEGRPQGKDREHYFRAKQILDAFLGVNRPGFRSKPAGLSE